MERLGYQMAHLKPNYNNNNKKKKKKKNTSESFSHFITH
jgi:hypothetical protein